MFGNWLKIDKSKFDNKISEFNNVCKCPYCENIPDKNEIKKFKCKNCTETVFVKKVNNNLYFLKEIEYNKLIFLKKFDTFKNKYFNTLVNNGYQQSKLESDFKKQNIDNIDSLKDFIWTSYNNLISNNLKNPGAKSLIYLSMSYFCADERNGADVFKFKKLACDSKLQDFAKTETNDFYWEVQILANPRNPECFKDNNKKVPFEDIMKNPILPHLVKDLKSGCLCTYGFTARRDANGDLIYKNF